MFNGPKLFELMRKIRKFVLQGATQLTREEMSKIEGTDVNLVDVCTSEGLTCVYGVSYGSDGHSSIILGTCKRHTAAMPSGHIDVYYVCE